MAPNQTQQMASYSLDVSRLRTLLSEFVREHATLEELLQIAMITTPEAVDALREVQSDGQ